MVLFNSPEQNLFDYYSFYDPLNEDNINLINKLVLSLPFQEGTANFDDNRSRTSMVKWIPYEPQFYGLYDILQKFITISNSNSWNFSITHSNDNIQYTEYYSTQKGKYDWHIDSHPHSSGQRKLSIVIQLSDPNEYEGGELHIKEYNINNNDGIYSIPKQKGLITVFPSYMWHRVTPVTKGTRKSLVWWVGGCPFR